MTDPNPNPNPNPNPPANPPANPPQQQQQNNPPANSGVNRNEFEELRNDVRAFGNTVAALPESIARAVKEALPQPSAPNPPQQQQQQNSQNQQQNSSSSGGGGNDSGEQTPGKGNRRKGATLFGIDLGF